LHDQDKLKEKTKGLKTEGEGRIVGAFLSEQILHNHGVGRGPQRISVSMGEILRVRKGVPKGEEEKNQVKDEGETNPVLDGA